jgi:hypothetical protein
MSLLPRHGVLGLGLAALALAFLPGGGRTSVPPAAGTEMTKPGRATVRGRVTLEGPAPDLTQRNRDTLRARTRGPDAGVCKKAPAEENEQQYWRIGDGGAVANVVVWLSPADGSHFVMEKEDLHSKTRTWPLEVVVGQRHLNYTPRVVTLFPSHFDPVKKKQVLTGQVLRVTNDSPVACNVRVDGGPENPGGNWLVVPKGDVKMELRPDRRPVMLYDSIHPWMRGVAWVFDHPYAAVTDRTGSYRIRNVPAGVPLRLIAWHEETGYLYGRDGFRVELKDGDNRKNLRIQVRD